MTRYPNLLELHKYHPYGEPAICDHAGILPELLQAVFYSGEELEKDELSGLARLYSLPRTLIEDPKLIMLDMRKWKHRKMADEVEALYVQLYHMANDACNKEAANYLEYLQRRYRRFKECVLKNELSYMHFYGIKHWISTYISFSTQAPRRRALHKAIN